MPNLRLLFVDDLPPAPELGYGYTRCFHILENLARCGVAITFFPLQDPEFRSSAMRHLTDMGISFECHVGPREAAFAAFFGDRASRFDAVLVSRPKNMKMVGPLLSRSARTLPLVFDCEAINHLREIKRRQVKQVRTTEAWLRAAERQEWELMRQADVVVSVSEREARLIEAFVGRPTITVGHNLNVQPTSRPFSRRSNLLFLGGFFGKRGRYVEEYMSPNEDAIRHFVKRVFPLLRKSLKAELHVVGYGSERLTFFDSTGKSAEAVQVLGETSDLARVYNQYRIFVCPTRYAAGIPWKVTEAFAYGVPCVATSLIADQLGVDERTILIADDPVEFADKTKLLYSNEELWNTLRDAGLRYVRRHCSRESFRGSLATLCNTVKGKL